VGFNPRKLDFAAQAVGTTSPPMTVSITNYNRAAILVGAVTATDDFVISSNKCPATLGTGQSCSLQVEFSPDETGAATGTLYVSDSDAGSPQALPLSGTGK
jgi:hypothetical protein